VNIDGHLLAEAKVRAARSNRPLGDIIDDALRRQFSASERSDSSIALPTYGAPGGRPLVDINDRDAVAEALGDNASAGQDRTPHADR
jgi:hypothetical protein